jgi:hypothetical protein
MPDAFDDLLPGAGELPLRVVALRLVIAAAVGLAIAGVYRTCRRSGAHASFSFLVTLVLLTVLVAMTTLVIGNNVARAFSLVGALAIVRFRTVVEDTRDTAFVIFAVVAGMAIGAGHVALGILGVCVVSAVALGMSAFGRGVRAAAESPERVLAVRVGPGSDPGVLLSATLVKHLASSRLTRTATSRQGAALDLRYAVRLRREDGAVALVQELSRLDGVQQVELDAEPE